MKHLSELIEDKQREWGISGRELARRSSLSEAAIRSIKTGRRIPKTETLEKLARALGISHQELLDAKDKDRGITRREFLGLSVVTAGASLVEALDQTQEKESIDSRILVTRMT